LLYTADENVNEAIMSPDGKWLVYRTSPNAVHVRDIFAVPLNGDRKPVLLVGGPFQESHPRISPDSRWMAYQSNESGRFEVHVRPFPGPGSRTVVSSDGGSEPVWSRSGQMLYYRSPAGLMTVPVTTGARFTIGERRISPTGETFDDGTHAGYDVAPDGQLLMLRPTGTDVSAVLVHNWGRRLREKLGMAKK
jgi:serine/threonine-protein kinase